RASNSTSTFRHFHWIPRSASAPSIDLPARNRLTLPDLAWIEHIARIAELAGDGDFPVLHHVIAVVLRKAAQHALDSGARARALGVQVAAAKNPHSPFAKQPIEHLLRRHAGI